MYSKEEQEIFDNGYLQGRLETEFNLTVITSLLMLEMNKYVHDNCKDVPHDIGIKLGNIIAKHFS